LRGTDWPMASFIGPPHGIAYPPLTEMI
jgi:hypothetical protein